MADSFHSGPVAGHPGHSPAFGPTSVSVHDDGHVTGEGTLLEGVDPFVIRIGFFRLPVISHQPFL